MRFLLLLSALLFAAGCGDELDTSKQKIESAKKTAKEDPYRVGRAIITSGWSEVLNAND